MCDPSHIQLAAAGTRAFFCRFRSTRIEREAKGNAFTDGCVQESGAYGEDIGAEACNRAWGFTRADRAVRQADELATRLVAAPGETIPVIIMVSKKSPEPLGPGELLLVVAHQ